MLTNPRWPHRLTGVQAIRFIRVENFQSIEDIELDLGQFTCIVGHSNSGKTALIRAIQAALFNWTGGAFVREGADQTAVTMAFAEAGPAGDHLRWEKPRKGGAHYFISSVGSERIEISRVGKEMPPEITDLTGFREIECEGVRAKLQVDGQFDEPFLLAGTGGQAARLLARVAKIDVLTTAQIRARRDQLAKGQAAGVAVDKASDCEGQLATMPDYDALIIEWQALAHRFKQVSARQMVLATCRQQAVEVTQQNALVVAVRSSDVSGRVEAVRGRADALASRATMVGELLAAREAAASARTAATTGGRAAKVAERALHNALGELGVCPLCGRSK